MIGVGGLDRLLQQVGHGVYSSLMTLTTSVSVALPSARFKHSATNFTYG